MFLSFFKIVIAFIFGSLSIVLISITISTMLFFNDLFSKTGEYLSIVNENSRVQKKFDNVVVVNYAAGKPIYYLNQMLLNRSAHDHGIDRIFSYNPNDIDKDFYQNNRGILSKKFGAGYWLWKPYIILEAMKRLPEDAIIFYIDSDCYIAGDITELVDLVKKHSLVFCKNYHDNSMYVKRDTYILMGKDYPEAYNSPQLEAGIIMLKNNEFNKKFIELWLEYSKNEQLVTEAPSILGPEMPEFVDHRHDQSIISLLLLNLHKDDYYLVEKEHINQFIFMHDVNELHKFLIIAKRYIISYVNNAKSIFYK